ncbi:HPr family phosphocarrier protein [Aneurinibacillus terranovensis]|uniref:HPr family phosphocarrier protein n=1 Tax=Aneurinibacillus terranovensis TaxID=278991 RepID=UPI00042321E1|nr:HPr family phosphocarrier protein [Aneurinibacillus terranovensis]
MVATNVKVMLNSGLHARPASNFIKIASKYTCDISLEKEGKKANAKSIMGVMSLAITKGTEITVSAEGDDAEKALAELTEFLSREH